jgi:hypothetical protein
LGVNAKRAVHKSPALATAILGIRDSITQELPSDAVKKVLLMPQYVNKEASQSRATVARLRRLQLRDNLRAIDSLSMAATSTSKSTGGADAEGKSEYEVHRDTRVAQMAAMLDPVKLALREL